MLLFATLIALAQPSAAEKCRYLEDLNRQYAGQALTPGQQQLRQELVAWYRQNCKRK